MQEACGGKSLSYDAEMMALARGLREITREAEYDVKHITILSDNKAALKQIIRPVVGPSQMAAISGCQSIRSFLQDRPDRTIAFMWVPSHKGIEPNELVDQLAKEALDDEQPEFVSYSMALQRIKSRMMAKWNVLAVDLENTKYRGSHLWVTETPLHAATAKRTWLLKRVGTSNKETARVARVLTNHFPCGAYRERFNIPGPIECLCGLSLGAETREHILFECPYWIRTKVTWVTPTSQEENLRDRQLRSQRHWTEDDILEFLRLNSWVATFEWTEILSMAHEDREEGDYHSLANATLHAHTKGRVAAWKEFHEDRHLDPDETEALSATFNEFTEWFDVLKASDDIQKEWRGIREQILAPDPPSPAPSRQSLDYE